MYYIILKTIHAIILYFWLEKEISGGTIKLVAKYYFIKVFSKTYNVCDLLKQMGGQCPIPAGDLL